MGMIVTFSLVLADETIRIHHECEGWIEKSVPRIAIWHHKTCRVMKNDDHQGWIFVSHPHTNNRFFFVLTIDFLFENKSLNTLGCHIT